MPFWVNYSFSLRGQTMFEYLDREGPKAKALFGFSLGEPVDPAIVPRTARAEQGTTMHDVFPMPGVNAVSERFRDLVEEFAPGEHQFFELTLSHKDGTSYPGKYYTFNCTRRIDTFLVRESKLREIMLEMGMPCHETPGKRDELFISRPARGDTHIWCENYSRLPGIMISDDFMAEVKKRKLTGLNTRGTFKELVVPYVAEEQVGAQLAWLRAHPEHLSVYNPIS
ncbi:imm11 family protein [Amaricoccus macauensis]|uniref:imm11 family protein n=1 Tax=Amaricoccus macauensis TaxID=57001 RepID=UPI003C7AD61B